MKVNVKRIHSRLEEIYQCGKEEDGTFTRMAYSPEDVKGRETFMNYFRQLGIEPRVDEAGNIHARLEGEDPALPAILTGSHLDTVPDGGKYDGVVGCVSGLEAVEKKAAREFDRAINCSGQMLSELFVCGEDFWSDSLRTFGCEIGRFIYLMDASMDYEKDKKIRCVWCFGCYGIWNDWVRQLSSGV